MNPNLLHAVRQRMREQSTEQLLALWVTNDRAMYSPEAFEAVRLVLAERGLTDLPPQNDPAPIADRHRPAADPAAQHWLGWLRPVLWVCVAAGAGQLPHAALVLWRLTIVPAGQSFRIDSLWRGMSALQLWLEILGEIVLPLVLLVGALLCLKLKPWGRLALMTFAALRLVVAVSTQLWYRRQFSDAGADMWEFVVYALNSVTQSLVLPAVIWVTLRRPEIRALFTVAAPAGFDLSLGAPAGPAAATAPADTPPTAPAGMPPGPASPAGSSSPAARY